MKSLYLVGAGGHCKSCIDVIELGREFRIVGLLDHPDKKGTRVLGYEVIGSEEDVSSLISGDTWFLVTVGQIKSPDVRIEIVKKLSAQGAQFATVVSPRAYVSRSARLGEGTVVMHDVLVNSDAEVGRHCILNSKSLVEHEVRVGDFSHVSTGAVLNGNVAVGDGSFIGSLSVAEEGLQVASRSILSAGVFHRKMKKD